MFEADQSEILSLSFQDLGVPETREIGKLIHTPRNILGVNLLGGLSSRSCPSQTMGVGVEFKPTTRSAPQGCDAAMKMKSLIDNKKNMGVLKWFDPPPE